MFGIRPLLYKWQKDRASQSVRLLWLGNAAWTKAYELRIMFMTVLVCERIDRYPYVSWLLAHKESNWVICCSRWRWSSATCLQAISCIRVWLVLWQASITYASPMFHSKKVTNTLYGLKLMTDILSRSVPKCVCSIMQLCEWNLDHAY
jgi:hypothetical protein